MNAPLVLSLDRAALRGDLSLSSIGGKALNLARLYQAGFPVPPAYVLTTAAYDHFAEANDLAAVIADQLQALDAAGLRGDAPDVLDAASLGIRERFSAGQMPGEIAAALDAAYAGMGRPPVAVRSSATAEDLPGFSFAGQHDTFLHVTGEEALHRAAIDCWSSLWTARAIAYRVKNGIPHSGVSLAVVVQEMVPSQSSGVLFTANPLTGQRDQTVIDATYGLGEALVSGQVEPDQFVVGGKTADQQILSKTLGSKALAIRGKEGGGTATVQVETPDRQALPDQAILKLAELGRRVAERFGAPQDVEWAAVGERLYLLQARPITTLYPLPEGLPTEPLRALFSFASVQGVLGPITPLGRDTIGTVLLSVGRVFGAHLSLETQTVLWEAGERLWIDMTGLTCTRAGLRILSALSYIDPSAGQVMQALLEEGRFPPPRTMRARTAGRILRVLLPMLVRALRTLLRPDVERERLFQLLEAMLGDQEARFERAQGFSERLALIRETVDRAFAFVLPQFVPRFGMGMATLNLLTRLASTLAPPRDGAAVDTQLMMRGVPHNVTTEMDLVLWGTAQAILADPESLAYIQAREAEVLADDYMAGRLPPAAQAAIEAFMGRYGMRGLAEIDVGRPRWREEPLPVLQTLRSYLEIIDVDQAPGIVHARGKESAEAEIERLAEALRDTRGGRAKAWLARRAAVRMRALIGLREAPKFAMIRLLGMVRQSLLAEAARLVAEKVLARPDDVFMLHLYELEALAAGEDRDWARLVEARRQRLAQEGERRQVPRLLLSDGRAFYGGEQASEAGEGVSEAREVGELSGTPVSPGTVEGVVRVVLDPRHAQLEPGEILVCPGTDPSWTPLFLTAGGLVMEVGGMMTHGAVVAREYGLPAVVGVHRATLRLHSGQRVRVDGSSGQVMLLRDE